MGEGYRENKSLDTRSFGGGRGRLLSYSNYFLVSFTDPFVLTISIYFFCPSSLVLLLPPKRLIHSMGLLKIVPDENDDNVRGDGDGEKTFRSRNKTKRGGLVWVPPFPCWG